jgi:hypothetical protein
VVVTLGLYWSLLESGLALIAACLPTLSALVIQKKTFTSMLQTFRSVFSLRSTSRSLRSDDNQPIYVQRTFKVNVENNSSGHIA